MENKKEYILCAAIWFDDGKKHTHPPKNIETGFVICGRRHHNCIGILDTFGKRTADFVDLDGTRHYIQGFITNLDRFVNRKEASKIAYLAKQIKESDEALFSEDLY